MPRCAKIQQRTTEPYPVGSRCPTEPLAEAVGKFESRRLTKRGVGEAYSKTVCTYRSTMYSYLGVTLFGGVGDYGGAAPHTPASIKTGIVCVTEKIGEFAQQVSRLGNKKRETEGRRSDGQRPAGTVTFRESLLGAWRPQQVL